VYYGPGDFEEVETLYVLRMRQRYLELRAENNLHQCMDVIGERLLSEDLAAEQLAPVPQSWPVSKGRWSDDQWVQTSTGESATSDSGSDEDDEFDNVVWETVPHINSEDGRLRDRQEADLTFFYWKVVGLSVQDAASCMSVDMRGLVGPMAPPAYDSRCRSTARSPRRLRLRVYYAVASGDERRRRRQRRRRREKYSDRRRR